MGVVKLLLRGTALAGLLAAYLALPAGPGTGANVANSCVIRPASASGTAPELDPHTLAPAEAAAVERDLQQRLSARPTAMSTAGAFTVPVVWTIFYDQNDPSDGNFPDWVITQQMSVLNSYFTPIGLSFQVQDVRRVPAANSTMHGAAIGNAVEAQLKAYRVGDVRTLNIYTVGQGPSGLAGWASFPWDYQHNPQNDGVLMDYGYLPGGRQAAYNTGRIMAHEIGHWAGLFHTFQGGCYGGDYVEDTPPEASAAAGCPEGRDTCPAQGTDPIHNMMDYTADPCRTHFTSGQYARMAQFLYYYRGINLY